MQPNLSARSLNSCVASAISATALVLTPRAVYSLKGCVRSACVSKNKLISKPLSLFERLFVLLFLFVIETSCLF